MRQGRGLGCGCLGCGGGTLLVLALLGGLAWFLVVQPARAFLANWQPPATQSQPQTDQTQPAGTDTPGTAAPLTRAEVQQFVRVRRKVSAAMGSSFTGVQQVWTDIQNGQNPNLLQMMAVLRDAGSSVGAARQAQSAALAAEGMTPERYAQVRSGVNRALGLPNIDFAQAAQALQSGQLPDLSRDVQTGTAQERALVQPFQRELTDTVALGLLGL
ncbi:hypothetical protein CBQ26_16120 [Deinococcus indicus]|uniref:Uncharacterized protein n=1 Tax=Deinococcus indicus TaxID=223556 RepID=A0A246BGR3_9DEIO|nr:hypothetical protein [Deinococcus indicus]OWL94374.1 hypothetical protein CBQ26_16120 [Deinococcus indicus]GHG14545.1 hypothetical protein GCM10017784_00970 [Deinococcus indicus]